MTVDRDNLEDYLELRDPAIKKQIEKSNAEYQQGKARKASKFLAEHRRRAPKPENRAARC